MIFHIDLDAFFASIEQRDNPKLKGKPVIVGGPSRTRGVVAAASYEARKYGIHSAMPLFKAFQLYPQVIFVQSNFRKYVAESKKFYTVLSSFTPFVEAVSVDEAYLSFYGFEAYYDNFILLGRKIKDTIEKTLHITASIGIGANKVIAKVASDQNKPDGLTYVAKGGEKAFLAPLAIRKLPGVGEKTEEKLKTLGIETVEQLANMANIKLKTLFGKHGIYLFQASHGIGDKEIVTDWERKSVGSETTFLTNTKDKDVIEQTLYLLIHQAAETLREEGKKARGISIKLRDSFFTTHGHQGKLETATDNTKLLFEKARLLLNHLWNGNTEIRLVGITTFDLVSQNDPLQQSLFTDKPKKNKPIDPTLDAIRSKHGFWSIVPAALLGKENDNKKVSIKSFKKAAERSSRMN